MIMPVHPTPNQPSPPSLPEAAVRSLEASVVRNPAICLPAAALVGVVIGCLVKRR